MFPKATCIYSPMPLSPVPTLPPVLILCLQYPHQYIHTLPPVPSTCKIIDVWWHTQAGGLHDINSIKVMKLWRMKSSMMQCINLLKNNRSVFWMPVSFIVPKTGPIHLVLLGLTTGQQADEADESHVVLKVITWLLICFSDIQIDFLNISPHHTNRLMASFSNDDYYKVVKPGTRRL